jgi:hypothetical protein
MEKYYYFVGVRARIGKDFAPTLNCDFILPYTQKDLEDVDLAKAMVANELFPTTSNEAIEAVDATVLNASINAMSLRCRFNPEISVHKFISEFPIEPEWFDSYISNANLCEDVKKKLMDSRIRI